MEKNQQLAIPVSVQGIRDYQQTTYREAPEELPSLDLRSLARRILRYIWVVPLGLLIGLGLAFLYLHLAKPTFVAEVSLHVPDQTQRILPGSDALLTTREQDLQDLKTVEQMLLSPEVLGRVLKNVPFLDEPGLMNKWGSDDKELELGGKLRYLREHLGATLRRGTRIIDIWAKSSSPERAATLASSVVTEFLTLDEERRDGESNRTSQSLQAKAHDIHTTLQAAEIELQAFIRAHPDLPLEGEFARNEWAGESSMEKAMEATGDDRRRLEAELAAVGDRVQSGPKGWLLVDSIAQKPEVIALRTEIGLASARFATVKGRYMYKHPKYIEAKNELNELESKLSSILAVAGDSLKAKSQAVASEDKENIDRRLRYNDALAEHEELVRAVTQNRAIYNALLKRSEEAEVFRAVDDSMMSAIGEAVAPDKQHSPRKKIVAALGGVGGLGLGSIMALGFALSDRRLRGGSDLERELGIPSLGRIPLLETWTEDNCSAQKFPGSPTARAFQALAHTLPQQVGRGSSASGEALCKSFLITSADEQTGKSFCSLNLAHALANQGYKTLLVDTDMRGSWLHRTLLDKTPPGSGLADRHAEWNSGKTPVYHTPTPNLFFAPAGSDEAREEFPDGIPSTFMAAFISRASLYADFIIIDSPSLAGNASALGIAPMVDTCLLVVREGHSKRPTLRSAGDQFRTAGARALHSIGNQMPKRPKKPSEPIPWIETSRIKDEDRNAQTRSGWAQDNTPMISGESGDENNEAEFKSPFKPSDPK